MPEEQDPKQQQQEPEGEKPQDGKQEPEQTPVSFEKWLADQSEPIRKLYQEHTQGLRSALDTEREQRKGLERQLKDAASKLEQGSEARKALEEVSAQLEETTKRAEFYEAARAAGVNNFRLAWTAAKQDSLYNRKGEVDLEALREAYPELFHPPTKEKSAAPAGNAGAGTQQPPKGATSMNDLIRRAAGRS